MHFPHLEILANVILNVPVFAARCVTRSCTRAFPVALVSVVTDLPLKRAVLHAVTNYASTTLELLLHAFLHCARSACVEGIPLCLSSLLNCILRTTSTGALRCLISVQHVVP